MHLDGVQEEDAKPVKTAGEVTSVSTASGVVNQDMSPGAAEGNGSQQVILMRQILRVRLSCH